MESTYILMEMLAVLVTVGAVGGFLSGLLGIGGGVVFVPALYFALESLNIGGDYTMHLVVAASLMIVAATVLMSARGHYKRGAVDIVILKRWAPFVILGVVTGSVFAGYLEKHILQIVFASITFCIAVYMFLGKARELGDCPKCLTSIVQRIIAYIVGVISALAGIGGASIMVPTMTVLGKPMQEAAGTSAALGFFIAIPGVVTYMITGMYVTDVLPDYSVGFVNIPLVLSVAVPAMLIAPIGVRVSHATNRKKLRRIFAVILMIVSMRMIFSI